MEKTMEGYPAFYGPMPEGEEIPRSVEYSLSPDDELIKTIMLNLAQRMGKYGLPDLERQVATALEEAENAFIQKLKGSETEDPLPTTFYEEVMRFFPHRDGKDSLTPEGKLLSFILSESINVLAEVKQQGIDFLTKLPLRGRFEEDFEKRLKNQRENESPFGLCIIDIDHFKKVNDTYGHNFGDVVIQKVAEFLLQNTRSIDKIYRYGGEEFMMIVHGDKSDTETVMKKIVQGIPLMKVPLPEEKQTSEKKDYTITVSIGATTSDDIFTEKWNREQAVKKADEALYAVKESGRNNYIFSPQHTKTEPLVTKA